MTIITIRCFSWKQMVVARGKMYPKNYSRATREEKKSEMLETAEYLYIKTRF